MMSQREALLTFTEELRRRKAVIKDSIAILENDIMQIDIQIRDIRQRIPQTEPKIAKIVKERMTPEQREEAKLQKRIAELDNELAELRKRIDNKQ